MNNKENGFKYTFELLPARASKGKALDELMGFAEQAAKEGLLHALSITDNAGGHPALTPLALGREIKALGIEPVIHFSCKDKNRNTIESQLLELDRAGLNTLMILTGDYPGKGFRGRAKPVFDLDSVQVLDLIRHMNMSTEHAEIEPEWMLKRGFNAGCVVSPFKKIEAEQVCQYLKLGKKIKAGAGFIVSQMGFDIRKFHELLILKDQMARDVPLYATVFVPDLKLARIIHKGIIPGCTIPYRVLHEMEQEAAGGTVREKEKRIDRAARLTALLRGIGFDGVHLSGYRLNYTDIKRIIHLSDEYFHEWPLLVNDFLFPEEWGWMLFERDQETGLNKIPHDADLLQRLHLLPGRCRSLSGGAILASNLAIHNIFFEKEKGAYKTCKKLAEKLDGAPVANSLTRLENLIKGILYDCRHCGDCALGDNAFLCPQSQCAKFLLNGPCGGSNNGWCEVWPGKKRCIYVRIYERTARTSAINTLSGPILPPRNWGLNETSSWINFYLGRDHSGITED